MLRNGKSGFDAAIYRNDQGQYVVAFRGTDQWFGPEGADIKANDGQALGLTTEQYQQAILLAKRAVEAFGKGNVIFTGHSLGGGLASAAMLATGAPGVTFNAAGLRAVASDSCRLNGACQSGRHFSWVVQVKQY